MSIGPTTFEHQFEQRCAQRTADMGWTLGLAMLVQALAIVALVAGRDRRTPTHGGERRAEL